MFAHQQQYLRSDVSVVLSLQRENAVRKLLDLLGPSDARLAKKQSSFYWRSMFGTDAINNAFYCKPRVLL